MKTYDHNAHSKVTAASLLRRAYAHRAAAKRHRLDPNNAIYIMHKETADILRDEAKALRAQYKRKNG